MTKQEFLAMSLLYELHGITANRVALINGVEYEKELPIIWRGETFSGRCGFGIMPILHPLSDLTKEIEHKGEKFYPIDKILENSCFDLSKMSRQEIDSYADPFRMPELMSLDDALMLCELHFDIAGLIDKGEAIDVNTLKENPYK